MKRCLMFLYFLIPGFSSCAASGTKDAALYLVTLESEDVGDVRFFLELELKDGKVNGGSIREAYTDNFGFADRTKINLFGGLKDKRLVSIQGVYTTDNGVSKLRTAFYSPISNYYLNGTITQDAFEGELTSATHLPKGKIHGALYKKGKPAPLSDYRTLSQRLCQAFETQFFDPAFLTSSTYKTYKNKLETYAGTALDDLHYVFSAFYYGRELPYSHVGIWRREGPEKETAGTDDLAYSKKEGVGILKIGSFSSEPGAVTALFQKILNDSIRALVIDLRNNPGGNIGPALELGQYLVQQPTSGGYFLSRAFYTSSSRDYSTCTVFSSGTLDQFMQSLEQHACTEVKIAPNPTPFKKPIYLLTDGGTASTCEPVVYALKQDANITVVGKKTAGKMLSAKEVPLIDGFVLFVPNADYVTPTRERLDQKGVEPEVVSEGPDALATALGLINAK